RFVRHRNGEAFALPHRTQDQKIAGCLRYADAARDGVRILPARRVLDAFFIGAHQRGAAGGLHRDHARPLRSDEADRLHFVERLPHADQPGAAAGRIENDIRHLPAELLSELEPHRFLAFDAIRLLERRGVEPADFRLTLADNFSAVVDQAVDAIDPRALQRDLADVYLRRVFRAEDRGLDAGARRVSAEA